MESTLRIQADTLRDYCARLFEAVGTPHEVAEVVAQILVDSDLKGHTSHGVSQIPTYTEPARAGYIDAIEHERLIPDGMPKLVRETPSTALVDGHVGWGHYAGRWCMDLAMHKARATGIGAVSLTRTHHIGRLGEFVEQAAADGFIGMVTSGWGGERRGGAVPFGGADGTLSTNPIALGVPSADGRHFISDFATTMLSGAKIHIARVKGAELPPGCIIDKHGQPSVDPGDLFDGGNMLVFGGYKGYAISLLTCLIGGLAAVSSESERMGGTYFQAIDISVFQPLDAYKQAVNAFLDGIRSVPPAPGFSEVLVPGDLERQAEEKHSREGIELPEIVWKLILEHGKKYGVHENESTD